MGIIFDSYLKKPITQKISTDETNDKLNCGTSTMQGWRKSQEDAHNCILSYDKNSSYFAVYDGHGGNAVALYCAQELPNFLKELEEYKNGNFEKALEEAFLKFDATVAKEEVIEKMKELAGYKDVIEAESEDEENINNLFEEAAMPLEQVIKKYTSNPDFKSYLKTRKLLDDSKSDQNAACKSTTSTSSCKEENCDEVVSSATSVENEIKSTSENSKTNEDKNDTKKENQPVSTDTDQDSVPSTNSTEKEILNQNGEAECKENCDSSKSDVSSTSTTTPQENGDVAKKGKGKALKKTKGVVTKSQISQRPKRTAKQIYNAILSLQDNSEEEEESEDEKDESFAGPDEDSSDEEEMESVSDVEGSSSSAEEEGENEEIDDEEEEEEDDDEEEEDFDKDCDEYSHPIENCGCTAIVALLRGNDLYVANAGDSRCVVCRNGEAVEMSFDHKPSDEIEKNRITKAGGYVCFEGRVNGGLNLSRAIGDHSYKQNDKLTDREQMITALPDIKTLTINPNEDEFMVLACDGIWNSLSNQEVVDFVRPKLQEGKLKLSQICEEMFEHCLAPDAFSDGTGCDNMTAIIVQFKSSSEKRSASEEPEDSNKHKKLKTDATETEVSA